MGVRWNPKRGLESEKELSPIRGPFRKSPIARVACGAGPHARVRAGTGNFASTSDPFSATPNDFASMPDRFASTADDFASMPNEFASTPDDLASRSNEFASTPNDLTSTQNDFASTPNRFASTQNDPAREVIGPDPRFQYWGTRSSSPTRMQRAGDTSE